MYRPASRALLRTAQASLAPGRTVSGRRFLTTKPTHLRSRSWKSSALRWGLAIAGIYFYNTSSAFADQPTFSELRRFSPQNLVPIPRVAFAPNAVYSTNVHILTPLPGPASDTDDSAEEASPLDLDSIPRRERSKQRQTRESATGATSIDHVPASQSSHVLSNDLSSSSPADLEEEASSEGAFNPETGEINWDCPCLGGMAHGPCGEDFKAAFSCFVFSKEEPKGMDCIDNFKKMQDCFREHPDVYAGELADDEEFEEGGEMAEGMANERAELAKEIQERRRAVREKQAQSDSEVPQKRLLEESPAPPRPARKAAAEATTEPSKTHSTMVDRQQPASSEPHPGMSEEHKVAHLERRETMSEGAPSQIVKKPSLPPVQGKIDEQIEQFDASTDLTPKVWHDARDADVPPERKDKR